MTSVGQYYRASARRMAVLPPRWMEGPARAAQGAWPYTDHRALDQVAREEDFPGEEATADRGGGCEGAAAEATSEAPAETFSDLANAVQHHAPIPIEEPGPHPLPQPDNLPAAPTPVDSCALAAGTFPDRGTGRRVAGWNVDAEMAEFETKLAAARAKREAKAAEVKRPPVVDWSRVADAHRNVSFPASTPARRAPAVWLEAERYFCGQCDRRVTEADYAKCQSQRCKVAKL